MAKIKIREVKKLFFWEEVKVCVDNQIILHYWKFLTLNYFNKNALFTWNPTPRVGELFFWSLVRKKTDFEKGPKLLAVFKKQMLLQNVNDNK